MSAEVNVATDAHREIFYADSSCQCATGFVETCGVDGLNLSFAKSINIIVDVRARLLSGDDL